MRKIISEDELEDLALGVVMHRARIRLNELDIHDFASLYPKATLSKIIKIFDMKKVRGGELLIDLIKNTSYMDSVRRTIISWHEHWQQIGSSCSLIPVWSSDYPTSLKNIFNPPVLIFVKGGVTLGGEQKHSLQTLSKSISVVGTRRADVEGCRIAHDLAFGFAKNGVCVVSGLATGIDFAAHLGALEGSKLVSEAFLVSHCPTITVLGHGFNHCYPSSNSGLLKDIEAAGGLIVTQFEPHEQPLPQHFLNRNGIITGISKGIVVVQAPIKSGSMSSARYALEQGKEVFVVPGSILDSRYSGSLRMLKEGANLITDYTDIFQAFPNWKIEKERSNLDQELSLDKEREDNKARKLLSILKENGDLHWDEIQAQLSIGSDEILELELGGLIRRLPGNYVGLRAG